MSRRLSIALFISIAVHVGLVIFLAWISLWPQRHGATLGESGGVVWFNLNPGGSGNGGAGGLGAPEPANPKAAASLQHEAAEKPSPAKPKDKTAEATKPNTPKIKEKLHVTPALPETPVKLDHETPSKNAGWPGAGQGDQEGAKTGPSGGAGEGAGPGEGSGSGGGKGPGGVGVPGTGGSGNGGEASSVLAKIRQKIARAKRYPRQARSEGIEGVCGLSFEINPDGSLAYVNLVKSSGASSLDDEALATVRRAAPFPYYAGPIRFSLRFSLKDEI